MLNGFYQANGLLGLQCISTIWIIGLVRFGLIVFDWDKTATIYDIDVAVLIRFEERLRLIDGFMNFTILEVNT